MLSSTDINLPAGVSVPPWRWIVASVLVAAAAVSVATTVDWAVLGGAAEQTTRQPHRLAIAALAYFAAFALRAVAWRLLMPSRPPVRELVGNLHVGLFLNHALPLKAGEIARPLLAQRHGIPGGEAFASTIVARLMDLAIVVALAAMVVPLGANRDFGIAVGIALVTAAGACAGLSAVRQFGTGRHVPGPVRRAGIALRRVPVRGIAMAAPLVLVSWLLEAGMVLAAASLLGEQLTLRMAVGATAAAIAFQVIHVTPGGLGVYEAAMTAALAAFGMPTEQALAVAVVTHGMKFAYAFTVGAAFSAGEGISLIRGKSGTPAQHASGFEIVAARLWNVLNEGKPFTPVFTAAVLLLLWGPGLLMGGGWVRAGVAAVAIVPLLLVFWRFGFPLRLRVALWAYLGLFAAVSQSFPLVPFATVLAAYFGFTVVLWGTVYYHLRIGTPWSNGFRFMRLVIENPDPTSGNFLEQVPKVLLLVFAFGAIGGDDGAGPVVMVLSFTAVVAFTAVLVHRWFFTWVPALPRPMTSVIERTAPVRRSKRVIAIVIDGCRADRLLEARTPCIDRLRAEGQDYRAMSTVYPARTVTCFSSMLTGAAPETHGMGSNFVPDLGVKCESVFDVLRGHGLRGTLVGIAHLVDAFGDRDVRTVTAVMHNDEIDDALVEEARRVLREANPDLLVLQLLSVDQTGHARGSYNAEYLAKIEETDRKIDAFLAWCDTAGHLEGATVMVTADHGQGIGIGGHGYMSPPEITIPCILWGEGIEPRPADPTPRFITDIAPTISSLLGVPAPAQSVGTDLLQPDEDERPVVFVLPCRNEEENLPGVLRSIETSGVAPRRVVVVDDGSTDGTADLSRSLGAEVVSHERSRGLGAALRTGLEAARALRPQAVVYVDADGEYDAGEAARLLEPILEGRADYVLGSRMARDSGNMTLSRRVANRLFSLLQSLLCGRWIRDGQTGFRAFSPRAADVAEIVHDYNYAQVLTLDLLHKGMRMEQVPVSYRRRTAGRSFVRAEYLWRVPLGMAKEVLRG